MRLVVVGTGLMGGSFALAARRQGLFDSVLGVEPDPERGRRAVACGVVDGLVSEVPVDADAVLLAGPSHTVAPWVARLAGHPGVLFDLASVKAAVVADVRARSGGVLPPRFVPCHPLAGSENSGPEAASDGLFDGNAVVVTPEPDTDAGAVTRVCGWWRALGARVQVMQAVEHDRILARTSHLPHLVAFAYLQCVSDADLDHSAGGFRDFTRIGAADADMWAPIFALNRTPVLDALDTLQEELARLRALLEAGDEPALKALIRAAATRRRKLANGV